MINIYIWAQFFSIFNVLIRKEAKTYRERISNKSNLLQEENFDDAMLVFQATISLYILRVLWNY